MMELPKKKSHERSTRYLVDNIQDLCYVTKAYNMRLVHAIGRPYYIAPHRVMWHDFSHHDCMVAGITNDLSSPHRPVRLLARSQSSTFQISLTRVFPSGFRSSSPPFPSYIRPQHFPQYVFAIIDILSSSHARTSSIFSRCMVFLETCATHNVLLPMSYIHQRL